MNDIANIRSFELVDWLKFFISAVYRVYKLQNKGQDSTTRSDPIVYSLHTSMSNDDIMYMRLSYIWHRYYILSLRETVYMHDSWARVEHLPSLSHSRPLAPPDGPVVEAWRTARHGF